jgi:hypothetical protein
MAYSVPTTAAGQVLTSAIWNASVRDNIIYLQDREDNPARAIVYHNAAQSIADASDTLLAFNSEYADSAALHDNSTNNSRITAPSGQAGLYLVTAYIEFAANATGIRALWIRANGTFTIAESRVSAASAGVTRLNVAGIAVLAAGEFLDLVVRQTSTGALNVTATNNIFAAQRIA